MKRKYHRCHQMLLVKDIPVKCLSPSQTMKVMSLYSHFRHAQGTKVSKIVKYCGGAMTCKNLGWFVQILEDGPRISSWSWCFSCSTRFISTCSINFSGIFRLLFSVCSSFLWPDEIISSKRFSKIFLESYPFCSLSTASLDLLLQLFLDMTSRILRSISFLNFVSSNIF